MLKRIYFLLLFCIVMLYLFLKFMYPIQHSINSIFKPYYYYFLSKSYEYCNSGQIAQYRNIKIDFDDLVYGTIGQCIKNEFLIEIKIDNEFWNKASSDSRFSLLLHELSHCFLDIDHINEDGHFMSPIIDAYPFKDKVLKEFKVLLSKKCQPLEI